MYGITNSMGSKKDSPFHLDHPNLFSFTLFRLPTIFIPINVQCLGCNPLAVAEPEAVFLFKV